MFTNAGMNQFKDYFLGNKTAPYTRVADTQKCLRVSGKHNDLEEVGVDTYHHTMFEMLGNWSFGDYFKKEAIAWSWELLTEVYKIPIKTVCTLPFLKVMKREGLPKDEEACQRMEEMDCRRPDSDWELKKIISGKWAIPVPAVPARKFMLIADRMKKEKQMDGKTLVNNDHPQVIEIWNNVFMQFNRLKDGSLEPLPAKHVDTGMGFERLVRVLQQKQSNYDTDIFTGTIAAVEKITGKKYADTDSKKDIAFRVIADHIRAICFTIADGQLPSNTGAGYVIQQNTCAGPCVIIILIWITNNLCYFSLMPVLANQFENVFPELQKQQSICRKS